MCDRLSNVFPPDPVSGGGRGIRTPGTLPGTAVFKTARFNHSRIPPRQRSGVFFQFTTMAARSEAASVAPRSHTNHCGRHIPSDGNAARMRANIQEASQAQASPMPTTDDTALTRAGYASGAASTPAGFRRASWPQCPGCREYRDRAHAVLGLTQWARLASQ